MTQVYLPQTLPELWSYLDAEPEALIFAGGTDLLVKMRAGTVASLPGLICLERLAELRDVRETAAGIRIGAAVTSTEILRHPLLLSCLPVLIRSLQTLWSPLIRNMVTIC